MSCKAPEHCPINTRANLPFSLSLSLLAVRSWWCCLITLQIRQLDKWALANIHMLICLTQYSCTKPSIMLIGLQSCQTVIRLFVALPPKLKCSWNNCHILLTFIFYLRRKRLVWNFWPKLNNTKMNFSISHCTGSA